jgi:ABC-type transport system involved in cytochrome c biogenesis permease component
MIERELRAGSHQRRTWWRRVLTVGAGIIVFAFAYLALGRWQNASWVGREIFNWLSVLGAIYALLAGPLVTADCLSRERREGTLGLLFLTRLRPRHVVLGKIAAASLDMVLGLAALLPLAALPFLMGGLSLPQLGLVTLALAHLLFFSLAVGTMASAFSVSARASLAMVLAILIFLSIGLPMLGEILSINAPSRTATLFYLVCPSYAMALCLDWASSAKPGQLWANLAGLLLLGCCCVAVTCRQTRLAWREIPASRVVRWCRERLEGWRRGRPRARLAWRRLMLDRNPVAWLEGRDLLQERILWALCLTAMILLPAVHMLSPRKWPDEDTVVFWGIYSQYVLCIWIAIQAPRRLADDKHSGALELLLCTPTSSAEIIRGCMLLLRRRFGRALLALICLDAFLVWAYFSVRGDFNVSAQDGTQDFLILTICAMIVFPVQAWSFARLGIYQGLVSANSVRASFMLLWKVGVLPWILFLLVLLAWDFVSRIFRWGFPDVVGYGGWTGAHLLACGFFVAHSNWQLRHRFRLHAAALPNPKWWARLRLFNRRPG